VSSQIENTVRTQYHIEGAGETYRQMYQAINLTNGGSYLDVVGAELFGSPRQIFFGIKLEY
jgi:hypothetical protein